VNQKIDRRKVRTKQLLFDALMSMLQEKGFEQITVTDISNRAEINRGTFYLHYKDVPDMLQQYKDEVYESLKSHVEKLNILEAMTYADKDEAYPVSVKIFEEFARHADFLAIMFGPKGDLAYATRFRELMASRIYEKLKLVPPNKVSMPQDYLIAYVTSANFGLLRHWLESGLSQSPAQMAKHMVRVIKYGPLASLGLRDEPGLDQQE
jgi:AcrR family transcriptional regulator